MVSGNSKNKSRAEQIIDQINADNAKRIALILVVGFAAYHGILHLRYGIDSCKWLLSDGRYKGNQEWQPYGCMIHRYSQTDTRRCLRYLAFWGTQSHFVFVGDSRIHELYEGFINHLQTNWEDGATETPRKHAFKTNLTFFDEKLRVKIQYMYHSLIDKKMTELFREWANEDKPPSVIVVGNGLETIKVTNSTATGAFTEYTTNLTRLIQSMDKLHGKFTRVLWVLQAPVNEEKLTNENKVLSNELVNLFNKEIVEVLSHSSADLWWSGRSIAQGMMSDSPDGIHLAPRALYHHIQLLLNMYCNDHMNYNDGTCCSSAESYTTLQIVTFAILAVCFVIAVVMVLHRWIVKKRESARGGYTLLKETPKDSDFVPGDTYVLFTSLGKMAVIMVYFFICDRTNFFMKENKYYSEFSFWLPIGYMFTLGLFFTEDTRFTKVLHRDQTDEWKGWMQLVILIYHMTGANRVLPLYMHMRVLISAYLFLCGYSHFYYSWYRGDFGLVRFFSVLFELNFMTVTLCLCMNRPYQFYNFVPLLSFWFMMIYIVLSLPPHVTAQSAENNPLQYLYLVLKFVSLFSVITILYMSEVFFEKVFVTRPWKALFVTTDDDIHEWWSRWKLDRYSTLYGMIFAVAYSLAQKYNILDDNNHSNLFSCGIALSVSLASLMGICFYTVFTFLCRDQLDCNEIHSYVVFIPIVGYIILRNITGILRTRYSSLFAWFGRISLELFISQYHIWLAADTHGVLVLIPSYPVLNVLVTSFIFVCACHEVNKLTHVLLPYAVPNDWRLVLRNVMLFLAVLVPIGINDGMF